MNQDLIWDHFQIDGVSCFDEGRARLEFLVRQIRPGERMLNIGVGVGKLEELALRKGVEVWALDPSERSIDQLRARFDIGEHARAGHSQHIPFDTDQFDVVVMSEVLEHLEPEIFDATLIEVRRVLRPGGRFLGTVPARERLEDSAVVCPNCGDRFHRWGHQSSFDVEKMRALLGELFVIDRIEEHFFIDWDNAGLRRRLEGLVKKFLSWRGIGTYGTCRNIYFSARKAAKS